MRASFTRFAVAACLSAVAAVAASVARAEDSADAQWVVYKGKEGPGKGKKVVLISGDEEYRSEECLPQFGKILSQRHGFDCTVLFAIDPKTGEISPNTNNNIPGTQALDDADLMVIFTRFRNLPDEQMRPIVNYVTAGKPIIGLRTATHAFNMTPDKEYAQWSWNNGTDWKGGFGKQVLGETWVNHHGAHGSQSTRGIVAPGEENHPILRGVKSGDVWGPTDVYGLNLPLPGDSKALLLGQVLVGMKSDDAPLEGPKNDPMMPVAWIKSYSPEAGKSARIFTTTMGAATDFSSEGLRRVLINASYWAVGLEDKIPEKSDVALVGEYQPTKFGFNGAKKGVKPSDHALKD